MKLDIEKQGLSYWDIVDGLCWIFVVGLAVWAWNNW